MSQGHHTMYIYNIYIEFKSGDLPAKIRIKLCVREFISNKNSLLFYIILHCVITENNIIIFIMNFIIIPKININNAAVT